MQAIRKIYNAESEELTVKLPAEFLRKQIEIIILPFDRIGLTNRLKITPLHADGRRSRNAFGAIRRYKASANLSGKVIKNNFLNFSRKNAKIAEIQAFATWRLGAKSKKFNVSKHGHSLFVYFSGR